MGTYTNETNRGSKLRPFFHMNDSNNILKIAKKAKKFIVERH